MCLSPCFKKAENCDLSDSSKFCADGDYCSSKKCLVCPRGNYCPEATLSPVICPIGYYCPEGSKEPISCPGFNPTSDEGASSKEDCYEEPTPTENPVTETTTKNPITEVTTSNTEIPITTSKFEPTSNDVPVTTTSSATRYRIGYMSAIGILSVIFS